MKKILAIVATLLITVCCFANDTENEEVKSEHKNHNKNSALFFDVGRSGYPVNTLNVMTPVNIQSPLWGSTNFFEIGKFFSRESGCINWVNCHVGGFGFGSINTANNYSYQFSDDIHLATENAKTYKLWARDSFGLQATFFLFSAGAMLGFKSSLGYTGFDAANVTQKKAYPNSYYYDITTGVDFSPSTYISLNIAKFAKIFIMYNVDLPIFKVRFITTYSIGPEFKEKARVEFFKGDKPSSVMVGACFFF